MTQKHTPTPWVVLDIRPSLEQLSICAADVPGPSIVSRINNKVSGEPISDEDLDNANFIARACNEYHNLKSQIEHLETLRPYWAQGFSSDGIAAQTYLSAVLELYALLGVKNQTKAVEALQGLLKTKAGAA
jgi:hypothetical protein